MINSTVERLRFSINTIMDYGDHRLFLYDDIIELVVTTTSLYVDNRPMNHRKLQAHKGLTNTLMFNIRNRDRKLQNVFSDELVAYIVNPSTRARVLTKQLVHTSDVGISSLSLTNGDLQNVNPGLYRIYITRTTQEQVDMPVYSNQNNDISFDLEISDEAVFDPVATQIELGEDFTQVNNSPNVWTSSALFGNLDRNFQNAQHSMAIYTTEYTGNVVIQISCFENVPESDNASTDWVTVETIPMANVSTITARTFSVNANWVRLLSYPDDETGTIDQILLRN